MEFDADNVSKINLENFILEAADIYSIVDTNPIVTYQEDHVIVTLKVSEKVQQKKLGFAI